MVNTISYYDGDPDPEPRVSPAYNGYFGRVQTTFSKYFKYMNFGNYGFTHLPYEYASIYNVYFSEENYPDWFEKVGPTYGYQVASNNRTIISKGFGHLRGTTFYSHKPSRKKVDASGQLGETPWYWTSPEWIVYDLSAFDWNVGNPLPADQVTAVYWSGSNFPKVGDVYVFSKMDSTGAHLHARRIEHLTLNPPDPALPTQEWICHSSAYPINGSTSPLQYYWVDDSYFPTKNGFDFSDPSVFTDTRPLPLDISKQTAYQYKYDASEYSLRYLSPAGNHDEGWRVSELWREFGSSQSAVQLAENKSLALAGTIWNQPVDFPVQGDLPNYGALGNQTDFYIENATYYDRGGIAELTVLGSQIHVDFRPYRSDNLLLYSEINEYSLYQTSDNDESYVFNRHFAINDELGAGRQDIFSTKAKDGGVAVAGFVGRAIHTQNYYASSSSDLSLFNQGTPWRSDSNEKIQNVYGQDLHNLSSSRHSQLYPLHEGFLLQHYSDVITGIKNVYFSPQSSSWSNPDFRLRFEYYESFNPDIGIIYDQFQGSMGTPEDRYIAYAVPGKHVSMVFTMPNTYPAAYNFNLHTAFQVGNSLAYIIPWGDTPPLRQTQRGDSFNARNNFGAGEATGAQSRQGSIRASGQTFD